MLLLAACDEHASSWLGHAQVCEQRVKSLWGHVAQPFLESLEPGERRITPRWVVALPRWH